MRARNRSTRRQVVAAIADLDAVVDVGHRVPAKAAFREIVEGYADLFVRRVHPADVVDAHVPFVAGAAKHVRESTGCVVALEHQHLLAAVPGQHRGCG
jgi:hypothetical protein